MGDEATTGVQTDATDDGAAAETASTETVLTGTADDAGTTNSDTGGDGESSSGDDAGATGDGDQGDGEAGSEESQTPPDAYADFALPEGVQLDETALAEANPLFKELGLTQDQAQKVVDLYAKQVQAGSQTQVDNFNQLKSDWLTQAKSDGEFGGDKFDENVKIAQSAISKYGTSELKQLLDESGVGNHPEVVRFMVRVGHTLKEDVPGVTGDLSTPAKDRAEIMYPKKDT